MVEDLKRINFLAFLYLCEDYILLVQYNAINNYLSAYNVQKFPIILRNCDIN